MSAAPDQTLYETDVLKIGSFRCSRDHSAFQNSGPIENDCFVFPRCGYPLDSSHHHM